MELQGRCAGGQRDRAGSREQGLRMRLKWMRFFQFGRPCERGSSFPLLRMGCETSTNSIIHFFLHSRILCIHSQSATFLGPVRPVYHARSTDIGEFQYHTSLSPNKSSLSHTPSTILPHPLLVHTASPPSSSSPVPLLSGSGGSQIIPQCYPTGVEPQ